MPTAELDSGGMMHTAESHRRVKFEYLGEIETKFENILAFLSGAWMGSNHRDTLPLNKRDFLR